MPCHFEHLRRERRRALVVAAVVGDPGAVAVLALLKRAGVNRWLVLSVFGVLIVLTVAALVVTYGYARGRIDGRNTRLDERDLALRQQAYVAAHRFLTVALIAAAAVVAVYVTSGKTIEVNGDSFVPVAMWVIIYLPALPALMLAWIEPTDA